jgi:hypothetical protein
MHMIDVMNKLKEIAESGYDNEDIQRGIDAAATQKFDEESVMERGKQKKMKREDQKLDNDEQIEEEVVDEANGLSELQAAYGAVYEYVGELDDEALEYVDRYAPDFSNAMDQYGAIADIEANSTPEQIQHYISELKDVESLLAEITSESVEEVHEDVEEDTSLADMLKLAGRSGVMGLSQNNLIAESLELDEEEIDEGTVKVTNIKWDSDDDVSDLSTTMMVPVPAGMTGDDAEEFIADYLTDKTGITHDGFRIEDAIDEAEVEETVEVPVSALSELMRLAGYEDYEAKINEYENDPEVEYMDVEDQMIGLSGGLNGPKKAYAAAAGGDNAMAQEPTEVEESLEESFYKEYSQMIEELKDAD